MIEALIIIVIAYLLGSVSGSLLLGRLRGVDIRKQGSGNAGGTNALRTQGFGFALGVVIIDVGKGWLAAMLPGWIMDTPPGWLAMACVGAAILGHMYPLYYGFRGGKGAATYVGGLLGLAPAALGVVLLSFIVTLVASGYVGLSTIIASWSAVAWFAWIGSAAGVVFATAVALIITFAHRSNIARLRTGTENRFDKARLAYWFKRDR